MDKLVKIMDDLWETESIYTESIYKELTTQAQGTGQTLQKMKKGTLSLYLAVFLDVPTWIPKPNKPGELRAISQPNKQGWYDTIGLDALSQLLNILFSEIYLLQSLVGNLL